MKEFDVAVSQIIDKEIFYPIAAPFYPPEEYPELSNLGISVSIDQSNEVYKIVRDAFILLKMDENNIGTKEWNPLSELVREGDTVVIKPNFVLDVNPNDKSSQSTITHASVIRVIIDYVIKALKGRGEIIVADAPQMNCNFENLIKKNGMKALAKYYLNELNGSQIKFSLLDLRREMTVYKHGIVWERKQLKGDPKGYTIVDLGADSEFVGLDPNNFYGADYNRKQTVIAHSNGHHKYFISNTILDSDVIISVPKLKVHRKVGVTLNLKNMVGINGDKNFLVHYRVGTNKQKGDEFSKESSIAKMDRKIKDMTLAKSWKYGKYPYALYLFLKRKLSIKDVEGQNVGGDWWGNDTTWRMTLDLNKLILYTDKKGNLLKERQRRYFSVIDGIVGGEGEGPLHPTRVSSGVILAGTNPVATDIVAASFMGIDYKKVNSLVKKPQGKKVLMDFKVDDICIHSTKDRYKRIISDNMAQYKYKVPLGWKEYL